MLFCLIWWLWLKKKRFLIAFVCLFTFVYVCIRACKSQCTCGGLETAGASFLLPLCRSWRSKSGWRGYSRHLTYWTILLAQGFVLLLSLSKYAASSVTAAILSLQLMWFSWFYFRCTELISKSQTEVKWDIVKSNPAVFAFLFCLLVKYNYW